MTSNYFKIGEHLWPAGKYKFKLLEIPPHPSQVAVINIYDNKCWTGCGQR